MTTRSAGACSLCGERRNKGVMPRHLAECAPKHDPASGAGAEWIHLRVEGGGPYWLDAEARADAKLEDLDHFLRRMWLECCGHMSAFYIDGGRSEHPMHVAVGTIFGSRGTVVRYEYDFGSTTELRLRALAARTSRSDKRTRVRLLARNEAPRFTCGACEQPATQICPFWEGDNPFLCDAHSDDHNCDDADCHLPVVNSPRMGVCGYTG